MAFWSGKTLEARLPALVDDFDKARIDCAAYTLRIGREVYVSPRSSDDAATRVKRTLEDKESFVIPPGQFAFVLTEERVKVPDSAVAFISMKARIKFKGLVNVSGFHVDPGYHGRLVFAMYNAGPAHVHLQQGEKCFLIWYASLEGESAEYVRNGPPFDEIPSDLITPMAGQVYSLAGLADRIQKVESEQTATRVGAIAAISLCVAVGILLINLTVQGCRATASTTTVAPRNQSTVTLPIASSNGTAPSAFANSTPSGVSVPRGGLTPTTNQTLSPPAPLKQSVTKSANKTP